jgi:hypothetical protein
MAALTTVTGSGTQSSTQSPPAVGAAGGAPSNATGVQPGTATSLLNTTTGGVALKNTQLSVVGLGARTSTQSAQPEPAPAKHVSPVLFGFSGLLFIIAIAMFWTTARSAKTTTE